MIGILGVGKLGKPLAENLLRAGRSVCVFDVNNLAMNSLMKDYGAHVAVSPRHLAEQCNVILSILPNDKVLDKVVDFSGAEDLSQSTGLASGLQKDSCHISLSTISPHTSRSMAKLHANIGTHFISAPVFARPDGMAAKQATFAVSGNQSVIETLVEPLLAETSTAQYNFGEDPGAANVVKLCGNFMIASAIESISESLALGEKNGISRTQLMEMMSSTIFDCLIYKGYGERISKRIHSPKPINFALELGLKDLMLVLDTAQKSNVPMPLASLLRDRFICSSAKGRNHLDWSSIGINASEDSGVNVDEIN